MRYFSTKRSLVAAGCVVVLLSSCSQSAGAKQAHAQTRPAAKTNATTPKWRTLTVKASSYTLDPRQTSPKNSKVGAFGDTLSPADKVIAVSRDLLRRGLKAGTKVRIEGLKGTYTVLDVMHRRWNHKIDILFAKRRRALNWGVQTVTIQYRPPTGYASRQE